MESISGNEEKKQALMGKVFWDSEFSRPFKITKEDINFSQKMGVPLPNSYYMKRIQENFKWMPFEGKLRSCKCGKCQKKIQTSFGEKYSNRVLCKDCYQAKIY